MGSGGGGSATGSTLTGPTLACEGSSVRSGSSASEGASERVSERGRGTYHGGLGRSYGGGLGGSYGSSSLERSLMSGLGGGRLSGGLSSGLAGGMRRLGGGASLSLEEAAGLPYGGGLSLRRGELSARELGGAPASDSSHLGGLPSTSWEALSSFTQGGLAQLQSSFGHGALGQHSALSQHLSASLVGLSQLHGNSLLSGVGVGGSSAMFGGLSGRSPVFGGLPMRKGISGVSSIGNLELGVNELGDISVEDFLQHGAEEPPDWFQAAADAAVEADEAAGAPTAASPGGALHAEAEPPRDADHAPEEARPDHPAANGDDVDVVKLVTATDGPTEQPTDRLPVEDVDEPGATAGLPPPSAAARPTAADADERGRQGERATDRRPIGSEGTIGSEASERRAAAEASTLQLVGERQGILSADGSVSVAPTPSMHDALGSWGASFDLLVGPSSSYAGGLSASGLVADGDSGIPRTDTPWSTSTISAHSSSRAATLPGRGAATDAAASGAATGTAARDAVDAAAATTCRESGSSAATAATGLALGGAALSGAEGLSHHLQQQERDALHSNGGVYRRDSSETSTASGVTRHMTSSSAVSSADIGASAGVSRSNSPQPRREVARREDPCREVPMAPPAGSDPALKRPHPSSLSEPPEPTASEPSASLKRRRTSSSSSVSSASPPSAHEAHGTRPKRQARS